LGPARERSRSGPRTEKRPGCYAAGPQRIATQAWRCTGVVGTTVPGLEERFGNGSNIGTRRW
jgi:hypothetical protein